MSFEVLSICKHFYGKHWEAGGDAPSGKEPFFAFSRRMATCEAEFASKLFTFYNKQQSIIINPESS
jgi:hypothetical protein